MTPKEPQVEGWTEESDEAVKVTEGIRERVGREEPNARVWTKGPVTVISTYVSIPGAPSAWVLMISKYRRRPNDETIAHVCKDFGMGRVTEIPAEAKVTRGVMEYDNAANGFI
jgi:hypothetical protein